MATSDVQSVERFGERYRLLKSEVNKVIIGQDAVVDHVLLGIFGRGHCLLVGVPGLAKTLLVNTVARALGLSFNRIQFTPDLMPSDIIGSEILGEDRHFRFIKGPLFANLVLADEINRTPPKTQAALLEAMQERAVTAAGQTHRLPEPFFVLATQNPIEQEGTYPLPEAQLDRFMFDIRVDYPTFAEELAVVRATTGDVQPAIQPVLTAEEIVHFQGLVRRVPVTDNVLEYAVRLATRTRPGLPQAPAIINDHVAWGAGPRASQYLVIAAKAHALAHGRFSPDIADVQAIALPILRHRIVRNYKAEAEGVTVDRIVEAIL
ncbi:MAG: AAA family ATPase [Flavobacteriales bacterium]|jgi:MoxR-like ATPase|nr:MAG: AAA family ATPase [Flavobacteriales bacterium]